MFFVAIVRRFCRLAYREAVAAKLLGASDEQLEKLRAGEKAGLIELAPVNLPVNPPGDCNHYGHPNGPAGVFRLTRTLNTAKLAKFLK